MSLVFSPLAKALAFEEAKAVEPMPMEVGSETAALPMSDSADSAAPLAPSHSVEILPTPAHSQDLTALPTDPASKDPTPKDTTPKDGPPKDGTPKDSAPATPTASSSTDTDIELLSESPAPSAKEGRAANDPDPAAVRRQTEELRSRVVEKLGLLRSKLGPSLDKEYALTGLLQHIFRDYEREFPASLERLERLGDLGQPLTISLPPSQVVPLVVEFPGEESVADLRQRELRDFVAPELTAFERRTRQEFRLAHPAPAFTQSLHGIGLQLVQERAYSDFVSLRNLPNEVSEKGDQAKRVAEQVRPHLVKLREETKHLKPKWLRCSKHCDFVAPNSVALAHHKQFLHRNGVRLECGFCQHQTMTPESLAAHVASEHGCQLLSEEPLQKAQCPLCPLGFQFKGELVAHLKDCKRLHKYALGRQFAPNERDKAVVNQWFWEKNKHNNQTSAASTNGASKAPSASVMAAAGMGQKAGTVNLHTVQQFTKRGPGRPPLHYPSGTSVSSSPLNPGFANVGPRVRGSYRPRGQDRSIHAYASRGGGPRGGGPRLSQGYAMGAMGLASYSCEICDLAVTDRGALLYHFKSFHKKLTSKTAEELAGSPPLACSRCKERFWTYDGLERHLVMKHGLVTTDLLAKAQQKADGGRCAICSKQYAFNLLNHLATDHQHKLCSAEIQYSCDVCSFSSLSYPMLEAHLEAKHRDSSRALKRLAPASLGAPAAKAARPDPPRQKLRYTCTPCNLKFAQYAEVIQHWAQKHLGNLKVHACRVDSCEECKTGALAGLAVDWSPPEPTDPLEVGAYANESGRNVVAALTAADPAAKPLDPAPTITLD